MVSVNAHLTDAFLTSALGDAWGYIHEFSLYEDIIASGSAVPRPLVISDDTQMAIATFTATAALMEGDDDVATLRSTTTGQERIREIYAGAYLNWYHDPRNNRAPGATCISALRERFSSLSVLPVSQ